ncbi:TRAP transporter substrate-binding protein [Clostridium cochlearium]|uniref:TRAP transporter substrate-binding protein n=1 Tax=Clostridium cochlearium TaxID=1494 RepID=UPI00241E26BD|nr:TRAP transporter substrate-binding protein [Clostridium cochlearium]
MKKKLIPLFFILMSVTLIFSGCNDFKEPKEIPKTVNKELESKAEIVLSAGEINPGEHLMGKMLEKYSEIVNKKSNGRIYIEVYAGGQLGDERSEMQAVQMGALDIFRANTVAIGDFGANKLNLFALPYLFRDRDHLWSVLNSSIGEELLKDMEHNNLGMRGLGYLEEGSRHFFNTKKPVENPSDLNGMKLRVSETSILMDTVSNLGASPTPISFGELFTSLQTGVVDGAEQPLPGYISNSFNEVSPYLVLDGHTYSPGMLVISDITWNKLSEKDQKILKDSANELELYNRKFAEKEDKKILDKLQKYGTKITKPKDIKEWQKIVEPIYDKYGADYKELIEKIRSL